MSRGKLTITGSTVSVELESDGKVWMSRWQLADLFGVYIQTITANIKAIIKSGAVKPSLNCEVMMSEKTLLPELYGMERYGYDNRAGIQNQLAEGKRVKKVGNSQSYIKGPFCVPEYFNRIRRCRCHQLTNSSNTIKPAEKNLGRLYYLRV